MAKKTKKKAKNRRSLVALISEATGHRYIIRKNNLNTPDKLKRRKYDPLIRKTVMYTEVNKNLGRNEVKPRKK
ncbi:MAG: 50S ribosomal protein L33 [Candidatus Saccharibacteria bacterium]|nr:50S ribosomal protein L33 [Candidatus Saccharibacteria bacterium]MCY4010622.1 50S ribosomal protein L33 [Candidatus Saccharibacteria bacterium]MCY4089084.1 50S ribosomal protein L33 [Candidatus Saccharibacteria bacterium]